MRDLSGRVERLEKRITRPEDGLLVLTVPYSNDPEAEQQRVLEEKGLTPSDLLGRQVVFLTSFAGSTAALHP